MTARLVALAATIAVLASAPAAQGAFQWSDGPVQRSYITNCASIIFGSPYTEEGAWTWNGQYLDPADFPNVGQVFYIHVVAGAVGNACSGQYVHFELLGTPTLGDLQYAITPATPVFCWAINWNTEPPSAVQEPAWPTGACPQAPQTGGFQGNPWDAATNPSNPNDTDPWPLPQGRGWELQIPVVATRAMSGGLAHSCPDCNRFMGYILDGNSSPQLISSQGLFVESTGGSSGGGTPGGAGGDEGSGGSLAPIPQRPAPPRPAAAPTTTPTAAPPKKCKKGQKLKKGKCVKKKRRKK
jgi:hypothetical protein